MACDFQSQFDFESLNLGVLQEAYDNFLKTLKSLNDEALFREFLKDTIERFQNWVKLFKVKKVCFGKRRDNVNGHKFNSDVEIELTPSDSVLQVGSGNSPAFNSSFVARRIELKRNSAELESIEDMAKVKARKLRLLAEVEETETLAKLRLASINLEAEGKLLAYSGLFSFCAN